MRRILLVGILAAIGGTGVPAGVLLQPTLTAQTHESYKLALEAAEAKKHTMALARLDGMLMSAPISVGIDPTTLPKEPNDFLAGVKGGIQLWESALKDSPFRFSSFGESPMLVVKFVDHVKNSGDVQGMIQARREFSWNSRTYQSKVSGTIFVVHKTGGRYLNRDEVVEVVAHELGHLFGLDDLTGNEGLMGAFVGGEPRPFMVAAERDVVVEFRKLLRDKMAEVQQAAATARRLEQRSPGTEAAMADTSHGSAQISQRCRCFAPSR